MSESPSEIDLTQRVLGLEREVRRLRWGVAFLIVATGLAPLAWYRVLSQRVVEVDGLVVKDERGNMRVRIGTIDQDSLVQIYGSDGEVQVTLSATPHGPLIGVYGKGGEAAGSIVGGPKGGLLVLNDQSGNVAFQAPR